MRFPFALTAALITLGGFSYGNPAPAAFGVAIFINGSPAGPISETDVGTLNTFEAGATGGSGGLTYQWDFGDGVQTVFDSAFVTKTHPYAQGAHLTVRVNVEDSLGNTTTN